MRCFLSGGRHSRHSAAPPSAASAAQRLVCFLRAKRAYLRHSVILAARGIFVRRNGTLVERRRVAAREHAASRLLDLARRLRLIAPDADEAAHDA